MQTDLARNILGSVAIHTKRHGIAVKLVFVRNRNKKDEYIVLLSTYCSLSANEVVFRVLRRYSGHGIFDGIAQFYVHLCHRDQEWQHNNL